MSDPDLPIPLGPCSNGEYDPLPISPVAREARRRALEACADGASRLGVSRRTFLRSLCAASTVLLALDACTREAHRAAPEVPTTEPGGGFDVPPEATTEPEAAEGAVGGEEFIMDVQGHLLEYDLNPVFHGEDFYAAFPQQHCGEDDPRVCYSIEHFLEAFFIRSDTNVVVLSALPIYPEGSPLSPEIMAETRRIVEGLCRDERILLHGQVLPNVGLARLGARAGWRTPRAATRSARGRRSRTSPTSSTRAAARGGSTITSAGSPRWASRSSDAASSSASRRSACIRVCPAAEPVRLAGRHRPGRAHASRRELRRVPLGVRVGRVRGPVHRGDGRGGREPADRLARTCGHRPERERLRRARHDVVEPDADADAGRPRPRQAAQARGRGQRRVGDGLPVLRLAAAADPGVPRVPDLGRVPGALRLSGADEGAQGQGARARTPRSCTGSSRSRRGATSPAGSSRRSARSCATATGCSVPRRSRPPRTSASTTGWRCRARPSGRGRTRRAGSRTALARPRTTRRTAPRAPGPTPCPSPRPART